MYAVLVPLHAPGSIEGDESSSTLQDSNQTTNNIAPIRLGQKFDIEGAPTLRGFHRGSTRNVCGKEGWLTQCIFLQHFSSQSCRKLQKMNMVCPDHALVAEDTVKKMYYKKTLCVDKKATVHGTYIRLSL